jgi:uncharacterized SAM-binding protein YcdF (DUF218 family)
MMIYLNKILPYLIYPITIILVLLIVGLFLKKRSLLIAATAIFLITSNPLISDQMMSYLEVGQLKKSVDDIKKADAIVVLSGMLTTIETTEGLDFEWSDPDRFFGGTELIRSDKAPLLIFTGGKLPWQKINSTEGEVLAKYAKNFGVDPSLIQITKEVQNTEDEAKAVKELLTPKDLNKIILVTSAFHMPRAKRLFEKQGFVVEPYPVDFKVEANAITILDFLPSAFAMKNFEFALRELLGRAYYKIKVQ